MNMTPSTAADALLALLGMAALVAFWLGPRRWLVTDRARDEMFAAREDFFDAAAAARISFDDPNYRRVREAINANIRFAHAISIMRIVAHLGVLKRHSNGSREPDARAAANAIRDPCVRWAAHRALNRVESAALRLLFFGSTILGLFILASLIRGRTIRWHGLSSIRQTLRGELQPYSDAIQAEALMA